MPKGTIYELGANGKINYSEGATAKKAVDELLDLHFDVKRPKLSEEALNFKEKEQLLQDINKNLSMLQNVLNPNLIDVKINDN